MIDVLRSTGNVRHRFAQALRILHHVIQRFEIGIIGARLQNGFLQETLRELHLSYGRVAFQSADGGGRFRDETRRDDVVDRFCHCSARDDGNGSVSDTILTLPHWPIAVSCHSRRTLVQWKVIWHVRATDWTMNARFSTRLSNATACHPLADGEHDRYHCEGNRRMPG